MRSLALASAWCDSGGRAEFVTHGADEDLLRRLDGIGIPYTDPGERRAPNPDLEITVARIKQRSAAWVVVDGYDFNAEYYAGLSAAGAGVSTSN